MSNTLTVKVASRKNTTGEWYEGTVNIAGLKPTKLARRSDGSVQFPTKSAISGAARNLAKSLGFADVDVSDGSTTPMKKAAKKSAVKTKTASSTKTSSSSTTSSKKTS